MQTFNIPCVESMRETDACAIYCIVAEQGGGQFVVKIGMSAIPYQRYLSLLPAIPFESTMFFAWSGITRKVRDLERTIHTRLAASRLHGEWFRFEGENFEAAAQAVMAEIDRNAARALEWKTVTEAQAAAWRNAVRTKPAYQPKRGVKINRSRVA